MRPMKRPSQLMAELAEKRTKKPRTDDDVFKLVIVDSEEDTERDRRRRTNEQRTIRWNTHFQSISSTLFKQNVLAVCQLASYLYLDATTVIQYCFYWLGEYSNREIPPHLLFNDILHGVLYNLPILEVSGQYGLKYRLDSNDSYALLLRFVGSDLHRVPHVHFTRRNDFSNPDRENAAVLEGFAYMLNARNKCFLNVYAPGVRADLQADNFVYNTVLEEFFEPSFIILTCFLLALNYQAKSFLYNLMVGRRVSKKLVAEIDLELMQKRMEIIETSLSVIQTFVDRHTEEEVEGDETTSAGVDTRSVVRDCIDVNDKNGPLKRSRLVYDLACILVCVKENRHDLNRMRECIATKWHEKVAYCAKQMAIRTQSIIENL